MVTSLRSSNPVRRSYLEWCGPIVPPCVDVRSARVSRSRVHFSYPKKQWTRNALGPASGSNRLREIRQ